MKKLFVVLLGAMALAGCNDVNGVSSKSFIRDCYSRGGVPVVIKEGDIKIHTAQLCIKKEALYKWNVDQ